MKRWFTALVLLLAPLLAATPAVAEDIDLFLGVTPSAATEVPNVLIIVDNTANWNQAFATEMAALANTLGGLDTGKFRVGIMFAVETGQGNNNVNGGYVRAAMRLMDATTKPLYQALVASFDKNADKGNGGAASLVMAEAYRYLSGGDVYAGNGKNKTDYTGSTYGTAQDRAVHALPANALANRTAATYNSPVASGCEKNYIIYISNGASNDNNSVITQAESMLRAAGGSTAQIPVSPTGSQGNPIDEWARFMKSSSLNVTTYTVDVNPVSNGQGPGWTAILKSMANVSGGKYFAVNSVDGSGSASIDGALKTTFSEIQSVNSVFASVSLPISVNTQGTYLNQVYIGMFRPDAANLPRWMGNLKQYKMGYVNNVLKMVDADDSSAINSLTGFVTECARSFWTPSTADSYWSFAPGGACVPPAGAASDLYRNSNYPDGNVVEKGGQAYVRRSSTARVVKTCSAASFSSCTSLLDFNTTNVSAAALGVSSTEQANLVNWASGRDIKDENQNGATSTEMRPSVHGDVVHSRPVAINYGTDAAPAIVVYYGANDGMLRAVNGNRSSIITSGGNTYAAGQELWAFAAPESLPLFKRIYDNTTQIKNPNVPSGTPKPYGMDGAVAAYQDGGTAWLYASMRRGGRALYAFDVSTPGNPSLKWKVGCPNNFPASGAVDDSGCSAGFSGIGQTWSAPKIIKSSGYGSGSTPMLVMGGGYDTCEDNDPQTCTASGYTPKGNMVYVLDANNGTLLKTLSTSRSVVGDVAIVPDTATGLAKYAYVSDLGGNLYRIDIGNAAPADWAITKIATLGCDTTAACTDNRKFMFGPDVIFENGYYMLMVGSGDREKPLTNYSHAQGVANHFFMVRDDPSGANWLSSENVHCEGQSVICKESLLHVGTASSPTSAQVEAKKGWYLDLANGEKVVTSSITLFGTVTFSTHQPAVATAASCSANLGVSNVYNISYSNAAPASGATRYQRIVGDGLPPSPVAGLVTLDNGRTVPFVIGASPNSPLEASQGNGSPATSVTQPKGRVYWYVQQ